MKKSLLRAVNSRPGKIELLNKIQKGKIKASDLQNKELVLHCGYGPDKKYSVNGQAVTEAVFLNEEENQALLGNASDITIEYGPEVDIEAENETN